MSFKTTLHDCARRALDIVFPRVVNAVVISQTLNVVVEYTIGASMAGKTENYLTNLDEIHNKILKGSVSDTGCA